MYFKKTQRKRIPYCVSNNSYFWLSVLVQFELKRWGLQDTFLFDFPRKDFPFRPLEGAIPVKENMNEYGYILLL